MRASAWRLLRIETVAMRAHQPQPVGLIVHTSYLAHLNVEGLGAVVRENLHCGGTLGKVFGSHGGDVSHGCRRKRTGLYHIKGTLPKNAVWKRDRAIAEKVNGGGETQ